MKDSPPHKADSPKGRQRIIQAALELFAEKGFSGTSMSQLAKRATVPQSLIYHYFESKEALWHQVKGEVVTTFQDQHEAQDLFSDNLETFIAAFTSLRLAFYLHNPLVIRIMNWQRLEEHTPLSGNSLLTSSFLAERLSYFQTHNQIRSDFDAGMLATWISAAITSPLFDQLEQFQKDEDYKDTYLRLIINAVLRVLDKNT